jgi:tetratricopeptide (TPR) repeat protein
LEHLEASDYEAAMEAWDRALELNPDFKDAWAYKGLALAKLNRSGLARKALDRGTQVNSDPFILSRGYAALGDKNAALTHLAVATRQDPTNKLGASAREEFASFRGDEEFVKLTTYTDEDAEKTRELWKREREGAERVGRVEEREREQA